MKKRILAMILALVMVASILPLSGAALGLNSAADEENACVHDYKIESHILGKHQYKCTKCGDAYGVAWCKNNDKLYDGTCDVCNTYYRHECDENGLANNHSNKNKHNIICSQCGVKQDDEAHQFNTKVALDADQHIDGCACGAQKNRGKKTNHDFGNDNTCDSCGYVKHTCVYDDGVESNDDKTHDLLCSCGASFTMDCDDRDGDNLCDACDYQLHTPPAGEHNHNYIPHSNKDGTHSSSCSCGLEVTNIKCADYNGDNKCDSCDYVLYTPSDKEHEHNYVTHTNDNGTHTTSCTCGGAVTLLCLDNDGDNNCDSCGYNMYTPPAGAHSHNFVPHSNNDGTHTSSCNCGLEVENIKCGDYNGDNKCDSCEYVLYTPSDEEHEHNYVTHTNNDGTHTTSCNCGNAVTLTCLDSNGDSKCDSCGYQKYVHNCVGRAWTPNNDGTHVSKCSCGLIMDGPYECQTIDGKTCYMCGYNMHKCNFEAGITSNEDGTHNINCECGAFIEFTCLDSNGDGKCDSCRYQKYVHNCVGRAWTPNDDGTHTSKCSCGLIMDGPYECQTVNGRTCYMCGYDMHKCFAETEAVANKDGVSHSIFCATCDKLWKSEGHCWENEVCTECGAKKISSEENDCKHPSGVSVGQTVVEPSCEAAGYILTRKVCNTCGKTYEITSPLGNAISHNWYQTITPATCDQDGNEHYECANCGDFYNVAIPATGHNFVNGECDCGAREYNDPAPSYRKYYTWDFQDVYLTQEP